MISSWNNRSTHFLAALFLSGLASTAAQQHFGMPRSPLQYAVKLPEPLYPPRADNN